MSIQVKRSDNFIPITIKITNKEDFDMEELSIKMFGLKKFLYKYLLPHNARIINFSLNGIYFEKFKIINWNDIIPIFKVLNKMIDKCFWEVFLNLANYSKEIKLHLSLQKKFNWEKLKNAINCRLSVSRHSSRPLKY